MDPFIQTLISYFKLNYRDGKITEAKAYLEQSPYIHHHYFEAYEHPLRLDIELMKGEIFMTADDVLSLIRECRENSVRHIRIYGGERYEYFSRLEEELKDSGMTAEAVLEESVESERLVQMHEAGVTQFLVEIRSSAGEETGWKTLSLLQELNISTVRAGWHMCAENAGELEASADRIKDLGITELVIGRTILPGGTGGQEINAVPENRGRR